MPIVQVSKEFQNNFQSIIRQRFSLKDKAIQLKNDLVKQGFDPALFSKYDIIPLKS